MGNPNKKNSGGEVYKLSYFSYILLPKVLSDRTYEIFFSTNVRIQ